MAGTSLRSAGLINIAANITIAGMSKKKPRPTPIPAPGLSGLSDAHTHLFSHKDTDEVLVNRARAAGVSRLVTVGDDRRESEAALATARAFPNVYAACAIHPVRANELDAPTKAALEEMVADPRCVAVGETGMDAYWVHHEPETTASLVQQEESLRWHIDLAVRTGKTLMIHNREADQDLLRILADAPTPTTVMLHCFSSPLRVAEEALERGYVLSFAGNVTFKRNAELRQAAALAPAGQLLVETDAPFMTPEPFRGQRNEPSLIGHTYDCIARARHQTTQALAAEVNETFDRVYGLNTEQ
nr:hydrolase, TatD family [Corynebacterium accolens ATCC 49725]